MSSLAQAPRDFLDALASLRSAKCRKELLLEEIPAPAKLAPYSVAVGAEIYSHGRPTGDQEDEIATGRFILLYDPVGSRLWDGNFRIVTYIRAKLEPEMGNDTMLGSVSWTWLIDALERHEAPHRILGGTATRVLSESFGTLKNQQDLIDIELRASWTPDNSKVHSHLEAWAEMVCSFAGVPELPEGVTALPGVRLK